MSLVKLGIFYALIGLGAVIAHALKGSSKRASAVDMILLGVCWPLYGPFVLMRETAEPAGPGFAGEAAQEALRREKIAPLTSLLSDIEAELRLSLRMELARQRAREIEQLLSKEAYDEAAARKQQSALMACGEVQSAQLIEQRLQMIGKLKRMRDTFGRELMQIEEMMTQLELQAEVVRIAGFVNDDTREMVLELVSRLQGLEEVFGQDELSLMEASR